MKTVVAIRHVPFEDLGSFASILMAQGYEIQYRDAGVDDLRAIDALAPALLVVLGGPISANDEADYPFLRDELRLLESRLRHDYPTLGICLGSQLMARVLGARVYPAAQKEIGWGRLHLTPAGHQSCLQYLASEHTPVLHWHGDTFDLPARAVRLAATDICENQAFRWGSNALALQFHAETTAQGLERWFIGHTCEIAATPGVSVAQLRADTARWSATCATQGRKCLEAWLQEIAYAAVNNA
jgi:GMP synthase (glutamine-hydrolysing)